MVLSMAVLIGAAGASLRGQGTGSSPPRFVLAFTSTMFTDVNENDAKAAIKAWSQTVAKELHILRIVTDVEILDAPAGLLAALRGNRVGGVEMTTEEYVEASKEVRFDPLFVASSNGQIGEEYVVLAHRDSKIRTLTDLRGRDLIIYAHYRACLARDWLDTVLAREGLPSVTNFFAHVTPEVKAAKVILPVFFRQTDACLVTRGAFATMNEMNPQTGKQLKIIAVSPVIVPAVFGFCADVPSEIKDQYIAALRELHLHPAGQQVLTVFRRDKLLQQPASCLQSAIELLDSHRRLFSGMKNSRTTDSKPGLAPPEASGGGS
jgi:phosphonate transport system substrate-binding protein